MKNKNNYQIKINQIVFVKTNNYNLKKKNYRSISKMVILQRGTKKK